MAEFTLSKDQKRVIDTILSWYTDKERTPYITLGGYAGTGKTTVISHIRSKLTEMSDTLTVAFCSYTGKAARVLEQSLKRHNALRIVDSVGTIHSLMYSPITNGKQEIIGWEKNKEIKVDLIIVDEASMVDQEIWYDLLSYGIPILAVGDHGQLPPVRGSFNLMEAPQLRLEQIHRQSEGNPIIMLSLMARTEGKVPMGSFGKNVRKINRYDPEARSDVGALLESYSQDTLFLCGYNKTRVDLNQYIRAQRGYEVPQPRPGDRIICLRNNRVARIYNGMLGTIDAVDLRDDANYFMRVRFDGEDRVYQGDVLADQFNAPSTMNFTNKRSLTVKFDLLDFGYALTVHKAQGSQSRRVVLFEERFAKMNDDEWRRWLYTGITRAEQELILVGT